MPPTKPKPYPYFLALYALNYMCVAVYGTFFPVYLAQAGYGQTAIGVLLAIGPLVTIAAQPFWGMAGDRARSKNAVLLFVLLGGAAVIAVYRLSTAFTYLIAATAVFTFFQSPVIPMSDAVTLEYATDAGWKFGRIRLAGTIGYADHGGPGRPRRPPAGGKYLPHLPGSDRPDDVRGPAPAQGAWSSGGDRQSIHQGTLSPQAAGYAHGFQHGGPCHLGFLLCVFPRLLPADIRRATSCWVGPPLSARPARCRSCSWPIASGNGSASAACC